MLKEKLIKALAKSMNNIRHENDNLPLSMRGELEVIVKDRDGNVVSYERGHNQVTNFAKMEIIHLLAGELGVIEKGVYSVDVADSSASYTNAKHFSFTKSTNSAPVAQGWSGENHSSATNLDGQLISGQQYFFDDKQGAIAKEISQVELKDKTSSAVLQANYPVKMLFGTGMEATDNGEIEKAYESEIGTLSSTSKNLINKINGFEANPILADFFSSGLNSDVTFGTEPNIYKYKYTNYYSGPKHYINGDVGRYRARTLQPSTTSALTLTNSAEDTALTGAIKNCYIMNTTSDSDKYNPVDKMATGAYRGVGYPAYIYARRLTGSYDGTGWNPKGFYNKDDETYVHYSVNKDNPTTTASAYETEVTYVVEMPAQPANIETVASFYPYNGWILKQAGLFSDSRYFIRSSETGTEEIMMADGTFGNKRYNDATSGMLLFKRNLSSPILKTADLSITFAWHVYIAV